MSRRKFVQSLLGDQFSHLFHFIFLNICTFFAWNIFFKIYLVCTRKTVLLCFPSVLINPCAHIRFTWRIGIPMFTFYVFIHILFKKIRISTAIARILIKINIHWIKTFYQLKSFFLLCKRGLISNWSGTQLYYCEEVICQFCYAFFANSKFSSLGTL